MRAASALKWFVDVNRTICDDIERYLPEGFARNLLNAHARAAGGEVLRRSPDPIVLDIGGGRNSPFVGYLPKGHRSTIIGLDITQSQISANETIDFGIVADACAGLPLAGGSIDVVVTRSLMEHLTDPRVAVREIGRVLRPEGSCVHVFPARFSPFSVLNRFIPAALARRLLFTLFPEWAHTSGFPAFYRDCDVRAMMTLHKAAGLEVRVVECRYYQSIYYKFFLPFYLLSLLYDLLIYALDVPLLACQVLLIAGKPSQGRQ